MQEDKKNKNTSDIDTVGRIVDQQIEKELHTSYLTYAMSTILDRALPDVRDGLKPSQRRILVAMNDLSLNPGRKHRKCAKICGDTSGNYHPHGEGVIYPTLVNMGQDWKYRVPLVDKQGNFGSLDGDPPAAMRYTEARMTSATVQMLDDLKLETVDYKSNYDETRKEPSVLPARFPNLLVNGSSGIAVGMACSMPPHNVGEICKAIVAVLDNPKINLQELMEYCPGPDFPTGGIVSGRSSIAHAYATGRGKIQIRGKTHIEAVGQREAIVIDEIPYQIVQNVLIEKIVDAVRNGRITDVADVKNYSGKSHRTRIVITLKRGADAAVVERQLFKYTPLQSTYSIINIALVEGRPQTLSLRGLIDCWILHRKNVIKRRTEFLLREAKQQAHKLEGLILAVCDIDAVIKLIRESSNRQEALHKLQDRLFTIEPSHKLSKIIPISLAELSRKNKGILLTKTQAEAIANLRLIQLTNLDVEKIVNEYISLLEEIKDYIDILSNPERVKQIIRDDCNSIGEKFSTERKSLIEENTDESSGIDLGELIPEHPVAVTISHSGYVKRVPLETYREQHRGGRGIRGGSVKEGDFIEWLLVASSHDDLLIFTDKGRVFMEKVWKLPEGRRESRGRNLINIVNLQDEEKVVAFLTLANLDGQEDFLFFATSDGRVKRTATQAFRNIHRGGIRAIRMKEGDKLIDVIRTSGNDHVLLASKKGMSIRFSEDDVRAMGRDASGVKGINLGDEDKVIGLIRAVTDAQLLTVTSNGFGKRTPLKEYLIQSEDGSTRPQSRGGKGRKDIQVDSRNGNVASVKCVSEDDGVMFISSGGMMIRTRVNEIRQTGRATKGVKVVDLKTSEELIAAAIIADDSESETS